MEIDQFAEFAAAVVRQLPRGLSTNVAQCYIRRQDRLAEILLKALAPVNGMNWATYLAPGQCNDNVVFGEVLEKCLGDEGVLERAYSLEDDLIKGWLADPSTYPNTLRGERVFLWRSCRNTGSTREVAYLSWVDSQLHVYYRKIVRGWWRQGCPALYDLGVSF